MPVSPVNDEEPRQTDLDIGQEFVLDLVRPEELEAVTAEFRLSSNSDDALQWQVGAYYMNLERDLASVLNIRGGFCYLDPGDCAPAPPVNDADLLAVVPFEVSAREREQLAAFTNITYSTGQWEFGLGLRADDWESRRTNLDTGLSGEQGDTEVLARVSASWMSEDENSIVYGTISQGFEPGDLNLTNFAGDSVLLGYDPENATQYELGYKGTLSGGKVSLVAALFMIEYEDRQFELQATDPSGGFVEGIVNVGDSSQWGLEADMAVAIDQNWTGTLGFGYIDAEWDGGVISPVTGAGLSGMVPPNTADWSATAALDYVGDIGEGMELSGRIQIRYKSEASSNAQFFDAPGDDFPFWENDSFVVVDLGLGLSWGSWELSLHVENVLDEEYYIDVQEFPNFAGTALSSAPGAIIIGSREQPRRAVAAIKYQF